MISLIKDSGKHTTNFLDIYEKKCELGNIIPLRKVIKNIKKRIIDINVDKIGCVEWKPLLQSLEINKNIRFVRIKSLTFNQQDEKYISHAARKKANAINTPELLSSICRSLSSFFIVNTEIVLFELHNLPLLFKDVRTIFEGISQTKCLQHISLENCPIQSEAICCLCRSLSEVFTVSSLNLSGCGITKTEIAVLIKLIQIQANTRQAGAWQDSLRYHTPNLDSLGGLRRVTLNDNPGIGSAGSLLLSAVLADDVWIKAIDLQNCALDDSAALAWLSVLSPNPNASSSLATGDAPVIPLGNQVINVIDLRRNKAIDRQLLRAVTERVLVNSNGKQTKYQWLTARRKIAVDEDNYISSEWPGIVGFHLPGEVDGDSADKRVICHNPDYQPKPMPISRRIVRPIFRPAGGKLHHRPSAVRTFMIENKSRTWHGSVRSRTTTTATPRSAAPRWSHGDGRVLRQSDSNESNRGALNTVPWRAAARAFRHQSDSAEDCSDYHKPYYPQGLQRLVVKSAALASIPHKRHLAKQQFPRNCSKRVTTASNRSSMSQLERDIRGSDSCITSTGHEEGSYMSVESATSSSELSAKMPVDPDKDKQLLNELRNTNRVHDLQLKSQVKKHLKKISELEVQLKKEQKYRLECEISFQQPNMPRHHDAVKQDIVLDDIYARLDVTLMEIEHLLHELADPNRSHRSTTRSEEFKLRTIRASLRKMAAPLLKEMEEQIEPSNKTPGYTPGMKWSKLSKKSNSSLPQRQRSLQKQRTEARGEQKRVKPFEAVGSSPKKMSVAPNHSSPRLSRKGLDISRAAFLKNLVIAEIPKPVARTRKAMLFERVPSSTEGSLMKEEVHDSKASILKYMPAKSGGFFPKCNQERRAVVDSPDNDHTSYTCPAGLQSDATTPDFVCFASGTMNADKLNGAGGIARPNSSPFVPSSASLRQYGDFMDPPAGNNSIHSGASTAVRKTAWQPSASGLSSDFDDIFDDISTELMMGNVTCKGEHSSNKSNTIDENDALITEGVYYRSLEKSAQTDDDEIFSDC